MKLGLNLQQAPRLLQSMQMILNPRMLALLKTLQLPYADLMDSITKAAEENPLIEVSKQDELLAYAKSLRSTSSTKKAADFDPDALDKETPAAQQTLAEHLMAQLRLNDLDDIELQIGEYLIHSLDERGYLLEYAAIKAEIMQKLNVKRTRVDKVLDVIQTLEPEGIGARDLKECLQIQIEAYNFENDELKDVLQLAVKDHLDDLAKKKFGVVAAGLGINEEGAQMLTAFLEKNLNPRPAAGYRREDVSDQVIPSFLVERKDDGTFTTINLEERKGPQLTISQHYLNLLEDPKTDPETKTYIKEKLEAARQFLENINSRHQTVQKIIDIVSNTQGDFFSNGVFMIKPLMQKELAQKLGVHRSTISRAISTKYIQTPQGVFPLKFLCPRNFSGYSPSQIKGMITFLTKEQGQLSDQKLCDILQSRGIDIKRRTVAKYRGELGIEASHKRT